MCCLPLLVLPHAVGNAFLQMTEQMQQAHLDSLNAAINGVQTFLADGCGARNCLNYTQVCGAWVASIEAAAAHAANWLYSCPQQTQD